MKSPFSSSKSASRNGIARRIFPFNLAITREGVLFLCFILILSLAAMNTGNNLLYIILATLLSSIVVSGIVSRNSLKQLSLALQMPENVFVGEKVSIKISMKNRKRLFPTFSIRVEDPEMSLKHSAYGLLRSFLMRVRRTTPPAEEVDRTMFRQAAYFPFLRPRETRSELIVQSFPCRGLYSLQGFWISTRFPFGFFRRGEHMEAKGEVLVYPPVQEISSFFHLLPFIPGQLESRHVGPGENLFSIRRYQEGESARIIDWKATAKTGKFMAREYAREEESKLGLVLDTRIYNPWDYRIPDRFERAVSLAASIAAHFIEEGAGLEFLTPREYVPRGTGIDHLYRILQSLAVVKYETSSTTGALDFWSCDSFAGVEDQGGLQQMLSEKVFKIIITSQSRGSFPSTIWRSSHVVFFDEL